MPQWFRENDRYERSARPGHDDRNVVERGRDEVRSWMRDDDDDDDYENRMPPGRLVTDGRVAVSGTRPQWLDRGEAAPHHHRGFEPQRHHHIEREWQRPSSAFWMVPGPHVGHGPNGYRRSDERILEEVCERLMQHGHIDARNIDVIVTKGEVTLRGSVDNREMKRAAEDVAESVFGVVDVRNELKAVPIGAAQSLQGTPQPPVDSPRHR